MTMSGYSNAVVDTMLGWLKGFANWVLRLFNLAGSAKTSPLLWLSHNWLKLLIFFLVLGIVLDRLIWLIRWRPYWVWFRKERIIVNDDKFFAGSDLDADGGWEDDDLDRNWNEQDYVVASTVVRRRSGEGSRGAVVKNGKRPVKSDDAGGRAVRRVGAGHVAKRRTDAGKQEGAKAKAGEAKPHRREEDAHSTHDFFGVDLKRPDVSDFYEDEVFNVSNLPVSDEFDAEEQKKAN